MTILYLHGLDSYLQDDRRAVLSSYGEIFAPTIDYRNAPKLFEQLQKEYAEVDVFIGSSLGGLVVYYLAQVLNKPCLLFNPALTYKHELPFSPRLNTDYSAYRQVVIGLQDDVITPWESLFVIREDMTPSHPTEIHLRNTMAHTYPIEIFEKEVQYFFANC
ncbi:hypothetical protein RCZ04_05170 [Capnocytophaga sp. HP1101]